MDSCIFCKIIKGELPCYRIYEDKNFLSFLDIFPRVKGHTLVIPKKHYQWTYDLDEKLFEMAWGISLKITKAIQKSLKPDFVSYITYGLEIPHAHIHIMPREKAIGQFSPPPVTKYSNAELTKIASDIRKGF